MMTSEQQIRDLLNSFQDGYIQRDLNQVDAFMQLFTSNAEVIGTNGQRPGVDEWYTDRAGARELVEGDWEGWGDLRLDLANTSVRVNGDTGWIAAPCTVTSIIGAENYQSYLDFVKEYIETSPLPAEQKLHFILRGGTNTVFELRRGEKFVWALRLTAVVVREPDGWKFAQMNFSFPTVYFPDVRLMD
jgi:hypothetical protein